MKRILVVDDDQVIRELLRQILEREGYEVHEAGNGNEAIRMYRENPTDLVISDIIMPDKEGIETLIELKRDYPDIKVIVMSGGGRTNPDSYLQLASQLGATRTFAKPFNRKEILAAIEEIIPD